MKKIAQIVAVGACLALLLSILATLIVIVPVALGIYAQKYLVRGLTGGAIK